MKYLAFLIISFGFLALCHGQQSPIRFHKLTGANGLSQGHVLCMLQDKEGYIWSGTFNGLNRYDGYSFKTFYSDPNKPNSLFINAIFSMFEDRDGKLWIGTWGIDIYDPETETIIKHITADNGPNTISTGEISSIEQDDKGIMWFGTRVGGLNKYDPKTEIVTWYKADSTNKNALQSDQINDLEIDANGFLWIATEGGGLSKMRIEDGLFTTYKHNKCEPASLPSNKITCIFEARDGTLWFGDNFGSLFRYSVETDQFIKIFACTENGIAKKVRIMQITQNQEGKLLLATNGMGLIEYDPLLNNAKIYLHESNNKESIISNENWSVLVSRTNTVFVGSYGRGISVFSPFKNKFEVFKIQGPGLEGKESNAFTDAIEDNQGHLITATYNGFFVFDQKTWKYKHYLPGKTYEENKILTLIQGPDGDFWLSSPRCLYRYDQNFNKIGAYVFDPLLKDHEIFALSFDYQENLWIALFKKGLLKVTKEQWQDRKKDRLDFRIYLSNYNDSNSVSSHQIWTFLADSDSNFYIGGLGGMDKYNYPTDNFTRICNPGTVKSIARDSNGKFWLGIIGKGLYFFDPKTSNSLWYTTENGLIHSFIYGVLIDNCKDIWITSEGGLTRFNQQRGEFRHYDERDGLPDYHFDDKAESLLSGGRLYFGTNNGFIIFRPESIIEDTSEANIILTKLLIDNRNISIYKDIRRNTGRNIPISKLKNIDLEPSQRDIEFHFASMHFAAPHKIKYSYMLKGYDENWIFTDAYKREAKYTNLAGGKYTFILRATNSNGEWSGDPLEINLTVHPPLYNTIAFKFFVVFLLFAAIYLYFRLKLIREKKQNIKLSEKVDERTQVISEKNKQLQDIAENLSYSNSRLKENQMYIEEQRQEITKQRDELAFSNATKDKLFSVIAHDLKAPFNVILGYTELLIDRFDTWDKAKQLNILRLLNESSESAYHLLENLLQWSQSQSGTIGFNPQKIQINDVVKKVLPDVQMFAEKKGVLLKNHEHSENIFFDADINMMTTILRNLIINAIKYSKNGDTIEIQASPKDEKHILFSIKDEGIGISKLEADKLFDPGMSKSSLGTSGEKGTGIGLLLCKDFVEYHHGTIWVESELNKGTTVFFTISMTQNEKP